MAEDNIVSGVRFGRRSTARAAAPRDPSSAGRDDAIELLVEGTRVLADALTTLAAAAPDDARAHALRLRCDALTRLIEEHRRALVSRRTAPEDDARHDRSAPSDHAD